MTVVELFECLLTKLATRSGVNKRFHVVIATPGNGHLSIRLAGYHVVTYPIVVRVPPVSTKDVWRGII